MNASSQEQGGRQCRDCGAPLRAEAPEGFCPACTLEGALKLRASPTVTSDSQPQTLSSPGLGTVFGDYELIEEIARGGMGVVYRARQRSLNRIVALKMILTGQLASKEEILRFRAEAEMAGRLHHPNIVAVHETGEHQGHHYFSMDFVQGRSLAEVVRDNGPLPAKRAAGYVRIIAEAIAYAHRERVLHRDLKPSNVLIDADDQPRITDFGLAKHMRDEFGLTVTGQLLGSPNFMPPEQAAGYTGELPALPSGPSDSHGPTAVIPQLSAVEPGTSTQPAPSFQHLPQRGRPGPAADVYGIGAILYHLLTGRPPFQAATIPEVLVQLRESEPISPRRLNPSVPRDLETICLKCLEKDPTRRYSTAREIAEELGRFLSGEAIQARPVSRMEQAWRWCRRKPLVAGLAMTSALLLLIISFGAPIAVYRTQRALTQTDQALLQAERYLYSAEMQSASEALRNGALGRAREWLRRQQPQTAESASARFEWRHLWHALQEQEAAQTLSSVPSGTWDAGRLVAKEDVLYHTASEKIRAWRMGDWSALDLKLPKASESVRWRWYPAQEAALAQDDSEGTVTLYQLPDFEKQLVVHVGHPTIAVDLSPDRSTLVLQVRNANAQPVLIWDLVRNTQRGVLAKDNLEELKLQFSPDSRVIALLSQDGRVALWDAHNLTALPSPRHTHASGWPQIAFSPVGQRLAISGLVDRDRVTLWNWSTEKGLDYDLTEHRLERPFFFSPDGALLATACIDDSLLLLETSGLQKTGIVRGHHAGFTALAFSADSRLLLTGSMDHSVKVWDLAAQRALVTLGGFTNSKIDAVTFSSETQAIVASSNTGEIKVWDLPTALKGNVLLTNLYPNWRFGLSPDDRLVATAVEDQGTDFVRLWDRSSGRLIVSARASDWPLGDLAFSPDGAHLAWVTKETLELFNLRTRRSPQVLAVARPYEFQGFVPIAFSRSNEIAFTSQTNVLLSDVSLRPPRRFASFHSEVYALAYSPDGSLLAIGVNGGDLSLWEMASGRSLTNFPSAHVGLTAGITFSKDGQWLASCGSTTLKLWRVTRRGLELYRSLEGHTGYVPAVAFSPDGKRLVSVSSDKSLRLWDTADGMNVGTLWGHTAWISDVAFSGDGQTILSISLDGTLRSWHAPPVNQPLPNHRVAWRP